MIMENNLPKVKSNNDNNFDAKLNKLLIGAGIKPYLNGYNYLKSAVKLVIENPDYTKNIKTWLYPAIAEEHNVLPLAVERTVKGSIEMAWAIGKIKYINNIFGVENYDEETGPSTGELISHLADRACKELVK